MKLEELPIETLKCVSLYNVLQLIVTEFPTMKSVEDLSCQFSERCSVSFGDASHTLMELSTFVETIADILYDHEPTIEPQTIEEFTSNLETFLKSRCGLVDVEN